MKNTISRVSEVLYLIDNTLVPHGAPADEHIINVFEKIHQLGIETCLISNNKEPRVKPFADAVNSKYIFDAHKPSKKNYIKAMKIMGTNEETTLFLGDQIFTDVLGAKRTGIPVILVKPIQLAGNPGRYLRYAAELPMRTIKKGSRL